MSLWATTPIFSYMFWPRPLELRRGRFGSFNRNGETSGSHFVHYLQYLWLRPSSISPPPSQGRPSLRYKHSIQGSGLSPLSVIIAKNRQARLLRKRNRCSIQFLELGRMNVQPSGKRSQKRRRWSQPVPNPPEKEEKKVFEKLPYRQSGKPEVLKERKTFGTSNSIWESVKRMKGLVDILLSVSNHNPCHGTWGSAGMEKVMCVCVLNIK